MGKFYKESEYDMYEIRSIMLIISYLTNPNYVQSAQSALISIQSTESAWSDSDRCCSTTDVHNTYVNATYLSKAVMRAAVVNLI